MKKTGFNRACFLCGMMGTGKSVIGKKIAGLLNLPFHDLDLLIEAEAGLNIPDIFQNLGESHFRILEKKILMGFTGEEPGILALGGGSLQNQKMTDLIKSRGILIFIDTDIDILVERLSSNRNRPLIKNLNPMELKLKIENLLHERMPYYRQAHIIMKGDRAPANQIAERIVEKLDAYDL